MPFPKSAIRAIEALLRGEELSEEQRATLDIHRQRDAGERSSIGRPPDAALVRFRKRYAPVIEFEALRARGVLQEQAVAAVTQAFAISPRTLWTYRAWVIERFPDLRRAIDRQLDLFDKVSAGWNTLVLKERVTLHFLGVFGRHINAVGVSAEFAKMIDEAPHELSAWMLTLIDTAWSQAEMAVVEALGSTPDLAQEETLVAGELIVCHVFEACVVTAIKSQLSAWKSR